MANYGRHMTATATERASANQIQNAAGGFVYQIDNWQRLERWLILGAEGGTYYASEREITRENAATVEQCLSLDPIRTVKIIVEVSQKGKAPKNDPAIFALALAASNSDVKIRSLALSQLTNVCRTGTHLFHFVTAVNQLRKWSAGLRRGIGAWYMRDADSVAYQAVKYQQRDGMSHRDVLRLTHQSAGGDPAREALFRWIVTGMDGMDEHRQIVLGEIKDGRFVAKDEARDYPKQKISDLPKIVQGFELIKKTKNVADAVKLIEEYKLPHECVPNELKGDPRIWAAMLPSMGITAMMRNLAKMTAIGLITPLSDAEKLVIGTLTDPQRIKKERLHPISILMGLRTYSQGHGDKGSLTWNPDQRVVDALDTAFYLGFDVAEPTGKNFLIGVDCSASMTWPQTMVGGLQSREIAAAIAMMAMRVEKNSYAMGFSHDMIDLKISPKMRLDQVVNVIDKVPAGSTNCSLPMLYASKTNMPVDTFMVITDNELNTGSVQPAQALRNYRKSFQRKSKLIVLATTATACSIADPNDGGMLDIAGFSTDVPTLITDFSRD